MINIVTLKAAQKFGPGYFIREQMALCHWKQEDLAPMLGITVKHLNDILRDQQPLTLDIACTLAKLFHTSAQYWVNLSNGYQLWKAS